MEANNFDLPNKQIENGWHRRLLERVHNSTDREEILEALEVLVKNRHTLSNHKFKYAKDVLTSRLRIIDEVIKPLGK